MIVRREAKDLCIISVEEFCFTLTFSRERLNIKVQSQKRQIKNINIKKTWTKEGIILGYLQDRGWEDEEYKFFAVILFLDFVLSYKTLKLIITYLCTFRRQLAKEWVVVIINEEQEF